MDDETLGQIERSIDRPLAGQEVEDLIAQAKAGRLDHQGQIIIGHALAFYRSAALRMEAAIHRMVKATERI